MLPKMIFTLPVILLLQILGVNASVKDVLHARDEAAPEAFQDHLVGLVPRQIPASCSFALGAISFCSSISPGFVSMAESRQASCLCYSSGTWRPSLFDAAASTCASYIRTADPSEYSAVSGLQGFCTSVGPVRPGGSASLTTRSATGSATVLLTDDPTITPAPTRSSTTRQNPGCSTLSFALSFCSSVSPGFLSMAESRQAPCLCYSSRTWRPTVFDSAVKTCANYVSTAAPEDYSAVSNLQNFCSSVGDVRAATASANPTESGGSLTALTGTGSATAVDVPSVTGPAETNPPIVQSGPTPTPVNTTPVTVTASGPATTGAPSSASGIAADWVLGMFSVALSMILFF